MVQVGDSARLAREALDRVGIVGVATPNGLDGDERPGISAARQVYGRHAALPQLADELVAALECTQVNGEIGLWRHRLDTGPSRRMLDACRTARESGIGNRESKSG